ncbi:hypothetical protein [Actinoplanes sp. NBRC 103695]|uniref:hypothetical protein n=1 Tax=Actinoplanes sp. NBRC 103695 TaxID=3032202 RepID=UPI0025527CAC|nr:hypothetical protein [Actinoplanes sp. NBRC 103695]
MKRRTLLAGTAGAAVAGLAGVEPGAGAGLERLLLTGSIPGQHLSTDQARAGLAAAARAYRDSRYASLAKALPGLLAHLHASHDQATGSCRETFARVLGRAYALASSLATKWGDDAIAMAMADRGLTAARDSGDGIAVAAATHVIAIAMRRDGLHQPALELLTTTAAELDADRRDPPPDMLGAYGNLLCTAAYASAQAGKPADTATYLAEATAAAERLDAPVTTGVVPFSPSTVAIYKIGVYTALGATGTALRHADSVNTAELPSAERYGRYLIDTARAAERHGHHDRAAHAVVAAARHAPGEVNRASVRELVTTLLLAPSPTSAGLRELATRIGVR